MYYLPNLLFSKQFKTNNFSFLNIQHDVDFTLPLCSCWGFRRCRCCFFVVEKLVLHWPLGILSAFFLLMFHFTFSSSAQICFIVTIRRVKSIFAVRVHTKKKKLGSHLLCKRQNFSFYRLTISLTFWCKQFHLLSWLIHYGKIEQQKILRCSRSVCSCENIFSCYLVRNIDLF